MMQIRSSWRLLTRQRAVTSWMVSILFEAGAPMPGGVWSRYVAQEEAFMMATRGPADWRGTIPRRAVGRALESVEVQASLPAVTRGT